MSKATVVSAKPKAAPKAAVKPEIHHKTAKAISDAVPTLKAISAARGKATAADLVKVANKTNQSHTSVYLIQLTKRGLIEVAAQVRKPQRGRPANAFRLTEAGRKVVKSAK